MSTMQDKHPRTQWFGLSGRSRRGWSLVILGIGLALLLHLGWPTSIRAQSTTIPPSPKDVAPFNQLDFYPIEQNLPEPLYRPVGEWTGRLILPSLEDFQQVKQTTQETDWAWLQVFHAPVEHQSLVGQTVRLAWADTPFAHAYVLGATANMRFTPSVAPSMAAGNIHPYRLDGRDNVGPLQSLAGFRPSDDVTVVLKGEIDVEASPDSAVVRIQREPLLETGSHYALVKFLDLVDPLPGYDPPADCPAPCASEFFRVQHYNPTSQQFDGEEAIVRVPQQPPGANEVFPSTPNELQSSPVGEMGWYIYGAQDQQGTFTVQALKPRSLLQLAPTEVVSGQARSLNYIRTQNWDQTKERKGTAQSVLVSAQPVPSTEAIAAWRETPDPNAFGTRMLVMHLFGARGGEPPFGERGILGTYTGHFSYGVGEVVQDPFTQEPQLDITYIQVYANNREGIIAGVNSWANYMGNLQRGWMGTRPVSDVLIKLDALTEDYTFGDIRYSIFDEVLAQLSLVAARYRTGDGSGSAFVTAATSCVQDSNQALYSTIRRFRRTVEANPEAVEWMRDHPTDPTTQRFQRLIRLGRDLYHQLTPMGIVRWDWNENANIVTGVQPPTGFVSLDQLTLRNTLTGLLTWRTATPRQAHDEFAILFLRHGGLLWFLRPNQIGGYDPNIYPIAATAPLGAYMLPLTDIPVFTILLTRTFASFRVPTLADWGIALLGLAFFGAIAYIVKRRTGFLPSTPWKTSPRSRFLVALQLLFFPALAEEYVFRVLLLPEPGRITLSPPIWWLCAILVLGLFVVYHVLNAKFVYKVAQSTFFQPVFLYLTALLGFICTLVYWLTGSLWTITFIHWAIVSVWILFLGGMQRLLPVSSLPTTGDNSASVS